MYALVDCNNFYASCERVFNPKLIGKPVAILSNNDGCVIARSNEVKPYVPMGAPAFKYEKVFEQHNVHVFSSNFTLYADFSNRVMNILRTFTPDIEVYSIDEAFLQFKGFENYNLQDYGIKIKNEVNKRVKIPVSIGFAPTKALAKIANKIAKKFPNKTNSVYVIDNEIKRAKALKWTKTGDVWGIGRRLSKRLLAINVKTAYDFTLLPDEYILSKFSVVELRLKQELEGKPILELDEIQNKKSIATTRSFKHNIFSFDELQERVTTFAVCCAEKLRKQKTNCNALVVFVKTNKFSKDQKQYGNSICIKLPYSTSSSITIAKYATIALKEIFIKGYEYKKAGVIVVDLSPKTDKQLNLFFNEHPKHDNLMKAIDKVNYLYGKKLVKLGSQNLKKTWIMKQERLSKRYTTSWDELLEVE